MKLDIYDIIYQDEDGNFYTFKGDCSHFPSVFIDDEDIEKIKDLKKYLNEK